MIGTKIIAIRVSVTVMIAISLFAVGWYLLSRFSNIEDLSEPFTQQEVSNPRLNHAKLDEVVDNLKNREELADKSWITTKQFESNPFYNPNIQIKEIEEEE